MKHLAVQVYDEESMGNIYYMHATSSSILPDLPSPEQWNDQQVA